MANAVTAVSRILQNAKVTGGGWGQLYALYQVFTAEPVNAQASVESVFQLASTPAQAAAILQVLGFLLETFTRFGLWIQVAGATPNVRVNLLQSFDDRLADYAVPAQNGIVSAGINDTLVHVYQVLPTALPWMRLQLVGLGGNGADTTVTAYLNLAMEP